MVKALLKKMPAWLQKPVNTLYHNIPYEKRLGRTFRETAAFLHESQWWTREQHEAYQMQELEKLIHHAYDHVPYYRQLFDEHGIKPGDIQSFQDMQLIPYLTKELVQENLASLVATNVDKSKLCYVTTGGSTGIPMGFYENQVVKEKEWAFMTHQWSRVGYGIGKKNPSITLRGTMPEKGFYQYDGNNLILSSYYLTEDKLPDYLKLLEDFDPEFIKAYPSSASIVAEYILRNGLTLRLNRLKAVLCGSENVYAFQRKAIEEAFKTRVYSWYGHTERCCLAGECEESNYYHVFSEYGFTELIGTNNQWVTREDELGEVVATGFLNYAMPFIRYKTMDLAVHTNEQCTCGRHYRLFKKVEGRLQELLVTGTGRYISMTAINMHSDVFDDVRQFQFYQEKPGVCTFNIVRKPGYTVESEQYIHRELKKKLGDDMELEIKYVEEISRTRSGKYRFLIQKLPIALADMEE